MSRGKKTHTPTPWRVLAVDDQESTLLFLEHHLKELGCEMKGCRSGQQAIALARKWKPHLVLLDMLMPDMDGLETCRRMKRLVSLQDTPVIFLSGVTDAAEKAKVFAAGAVDFLTKPIAPVELRARVRTHLSLGTKLRRLAHRAKAEALLLQEVMDGIEDALLIFQALRNEQGEALSFEVAYANSRVSPVLGLDDKNLTGLRSHQLRPWFSDELHQDFALSLETLQRVEREVDIEVRPEKFRPFRVACVPLENDLIAVFYRDLAFYKAMQEERDAALRSKLLAERISHLGMLAAGIGHEINNPNAAITLNLPLLERIWNEIEPLLLREKQAGRMDKLCGLPVEQMADHVKTLLKGSQRSARRIKEIVQLMRSFVRMGAAPIEFRLLKINFVVSAAIAAVRERLTRSGYPLRTELAENLPLVRGDAARLEQAIVNLLLNSLDALDAMPSKQGGITVRTLAVKSNDKRRRFIEIWVIDEGQGMTESVLQRARQPFYTTRQERGGTGLGVSLVQQIMDEHEGTLEYDSKPGKGTKACLRLPGVEEL